LTARGLERHGASSRSTGFVVQQITGFGVSPRGWPAAVSRLVALGATVGRFWPKADLRTMIPRKALSIDSYDNEDFVIHDYQAQTCIKAAAAV
jgi:hypothetical protein